MAQWHATQELGHVFDFQNSHLKKKRSTSNPSVGEVEILGLSLATQSSQLGQLQVQ